MRYVDTTTPSRPTPTLILARDLQPGMDNSISFLLDAHRPSSWRSSSGGSSRTRIVDPSDVAIAVMGATGSGKTTFINKVSGSTLRVGRGLQSCTSVVQVAQPFELDGFSVTLIDTPGFDDTTKSDTDILRMIAAFLATAYENGKKLAGVIYIHRISDFRMGGISTRNFKMFRQLCGESTLKNVVLVTNMWGEVSKEVGESREAELAREDIFFKPVIEKGARLLRHDNTVESVQEILRCIIGNQPRSLRIQRELVDEKKDISQTAAGAELNRDLLQQAEKHRLEMIVLQEEMREAIRTKDIETKRELEIETRKLQAEMNRVQADSRKLASTYSEEKARLERSMEELMDSARREAERVSAEHQRQIRTLESRLQEGALASAAERAEITRQLDRLRQQPPHGGLFGMIGRAIDAVFGL